LKNSIPALAVASLIASVVLALGGCTGPDEAAVADSGSATPQADAAPAGMIRGEGLETMDSGGYTYALLQTAEDRRWVATRLTELDVGDVLDLPPGMAMTGFTSRSLNRTFDVIYFVDSVSKVSDAAGATTT